MSLNLDFWKLLAGLGIFLFGMLLIEESVKALSGRAFLHNMEEFDGADSVYLNTQYMSF